MMAWILIFTLALLPMLLYALALWWMDRYEKEPLGLILAAFLWGALPAVLFSIIAQAVLDIPISALGPGMGYKLASSSLIAPVTEETFKAIVLLLSWRFRREMDTPVDGILYGGLVGFGFATTENLFYFLDAYDTGGLGSVLMLAFFRAVVFGLNHALFTACTGLGIALARTSPRWEVRMLAPPLGLLAAMALHGVHNFGAVLTSLTCWSLLISVLSDWGGVLALVGLLVYFSVRERTYLVRYLAEEVQEGRIPAEDYLILCSYWRRVGRRLEALLRGDLRRWRRLGAYYRVASELAFAKHRLAAAGADAEARHRIEPLRQEVERWRG